MTHNPMCHEGTPVEHYPELRLWVKREDLSCPGGPNFSKTRGVYAHVRSRPERIIGVLDTSHSQGGWAVARACDLLGKQCVLYFPITKAMREKGYTLHPQQDAAAKLGAVLVPLQAGRSAVLYHTAKKLLAEKRLGTRGPDPTYMMPNALKLPEMITETVAEVLRTPLPPVGMVIVSASSGTIAAGVIIGLHEKGYTGGIVVHQGYSRSDKAVRAYMDKMAVGYNGRPMPRSFLLVDEGYSYADRARSGPVPPFPCNEFYDLKAFRWWMIEAGMVRGAKEVLLWNIG